MIKVVELACKVVRRMTSLCISLCQIEGYSESTMQQGQRRRVQQVIQPIGTVVDGSVGAFLHQQLREDQNCFDQFSITFWAKASLFQTLFIEPRATLEK